VPLPDPAELDAAAADPAGGRPADDAFPPELHPLVARYALLGELGRGGMAVVYHARERAPDGGAAGVLEREVAIKVVSPRYSGDADAVRRFEREARTVAALDHPNIVRTLAIEALTEDAVAIVSRYVPGVTLRAALRGAGGPFAYARAAAVLRDLAAALAYAHARRIVHRDVKPENVFLEEPGGRALLADFGIARPLDVDSPLTVDGASMGTPTYMAPEQITGRAIDERTDVYALGLVGWEMLAGRRPWQGETLYAVLHRQQHDELPDLALLRPDIPAYLLAAVRGALAKDPAARWRDGAEFLGRLTPAPVALPALPDASDAAADTLHPADHTMRLDTGRLTPDATQAVALGGGRPEAAGARRRARRLGPARQAGRWVAVAAVLAALGVTGAVLARRGAAEARRAQDAATTGVTDRQLDSLLRAAAAAAPLPADAAAAGEAPPAAASPPAAVPPVAAPGRGTAAPVERPAPAAGRRRTSGGASVPAAEVRFAGAERDARCQSPASGDQRACLMAALERSDAGLTRDYQALIAALRQQAGGAREPNSVEALRAEQRAWIDARDRQCREVLAGREGPLWGAARAPCFAALSERRAGELRGRLTRLTEPPAP
jgi:uncharacterized protein YecT (DUF1311 family)